MGDQSQPDNSELRQHTPTPWRVTEGRAFVEQAAPLGLFVADCRITDEGHANAAFIVEAVNSHDKLQRDLEDAQIELRNLGNMGIAALKSRVEELTKALEEIASFDITPDTGYSVAQAMRRTAAMSLEGRGGAT